MNPFCVDIATACHILVKQKLDSGPFGNISIRIPDRDQFWVNPEGITFDQISARDMVLMDLQGNILEGQHSPHPGEFIHREIYKVRKDIQAIVHTHSKNTVAISLLGCEIEPFTQLGASIYQDQGIYSGFTGPVRTTEEGFEIAKALGTKSILIAKNHGLFATGDTIKAALWDMIIADMAADIHLSALKLGLKQAEILQVEDLRKSKIEVRHKQNEYMWNAYCNQLDTKNKRTDTKSVTLRSVI